MAAPQLITYNNKVAVNPVTVAENQVLDTDMNQIKDVVNNNANAMLFKGTNILDELTVIDTSAFAININNAGATSFVVNDQGMSLNGDIRVIPVGVVPEVGKVLGYINVDGDLGMFDLGGTGLEAIDEGNGIGWRLIGKDPNDYVNIGENAIDLSSVSLAVSNRGAGGEFSFSVGADAYAGAQGAMAMGSQTEATGINSFAAINGANASGANAIAMGNASIASGFQSQAIGAGASATGFKSSAFGIDVMSFSANEMAFGAYNTEYIPVGDDTDRALVGGIGDDTLNKKDGIIIFKNGLAILPETTNALIDSDEKSIITKEYADVNYGVSNKIVVDLGDAQADNLITNTLFAVNPTVNRTYSQNSRDVIYNIDFDNISTVNMIANDVYEYRATFDIPVQSMIGKRFSGSISSLDVDTVFEIVQQAVIVNAIGGVAQVTVLINARSSANASYDLDLSATGQYISNSFPAFIEQTVAATDQNPADLSINYPATINENDILFVQIYHNGTGNNVSIPAGWNLAEQNEFGQSLTGLYWRRANGTEGGTNVTFSVIGGTSNLVYGAMSRFSGCVISGTPFENIVSEPQADTDIVAVTANQSLGERRLNLVFLNIEDNEDSTTDPTDSGYVESFLTTTAIGSNGTLGLYTIELDLPGLSPNASYEFDGGDTNDACVYSLMLIPQ